MRGIYTPVEQAMVSDWMGLPRPRGSQSLRLDHPRWLRTLRAVFPGSVRPRPGPDGAFGAFTLADAVARLALEAVPARLASAPGSQPEAAAGYLPPRTLLEVDWARVGTPAYQPEVYSLCDLPGWGARVVVASRESVEAYGYHAVAIGWLGHAEPELAASARVLRAWWIARASDGAPRWDEVLAGGLLGEARALELAASVWDDPDRGWLAG
jgi:hypothetical protein